MKTTSIELSKRFDGLGLKRATDHFYIYDAYTGQWVCLHGLAIDELSFTPPKEYAAYALDEVLDMLPNHIVTLESLCHLDMQRLVDTYIFAYRFPTNTGRPAYQDFLHENPAEAAGLLLEWCIQNGHVKVEELNDGGTNEQAD